MRLLVSAEDFNAPIMAGISKHVSYFGKLLFVDFHLFEPFT